jgi:hypothetical protein
MFRRFLEVTDERLPCLAVTKTNLSVHVVGMELSLNGLPDDEVDISGFSGEDGAEGLPEPPEQYTRVYSVHHEDRK